MTHEQILEEITVEADGIYEGSTTRVFSPEKLAAFLAKHLPAEEEKEV